MGLFDSECALSGLSLHAFVEVAAIPLSATGGERGPAVFGPPDRAGSIDVQSAPAAPLALAAPPILKAVLEHAAGVAEFCESRGRPLAPRHDGSQHTLGDVLVRHARAVRELADLPWMREPLTECARVAEENVVRRLGRDAPRSGWLEGNSFYGVYFGRERVACTSLEALRRAINDVSGYAFDPDTLKVIAEMGVLVVQRGLPHEIPLRPYLYVSYAGRRACLEDTKSADDIYATFVDDEDPKIEIDWTAFAPHVAALDAPLAKPRSEALLGSSFGETPTWAAPGETRFGLTRFAYIPF